MPVDICRCALDGIVDSVVNIEGRGIGISHTGAPYVAFVGKENAAKAAKFHEKDHIKLGDIDVTTKYDRDKKVTYTNFSCFSFETTNVSGSIKQQSENPASEGENPNDGDVGGDGLPF